MRFGAIESGPIEPNKITDPSGAAFAVKACAILPPAPGLLSTMTF